MTVMVNSFIISGTCYMMACFIGWFAGHVIDGHFGLE